MRSELQEVLDLVPVEDYLDHEGIDYKETPGRTGRQANLRTCPVCGGSTWKVYLNLENGLGNCFSGDCEAKFNYYSFVKAHCGADKPGQVFNHLKEIARGLGWRPKRVVQVAVNVNTVKLPPSYPLPISGENLLYLEQRGITAEYAAHFHLRWCMEGWWNFITPEGKRSGQNFSGRCIIPVFDLDGELVTFQGRDITGESDRRYLFPATLPGTGRYLYNGHNATRSRRVVLNEGAFDVMATKVALDEDPAMRAIVPIGSFGKHLSAGDTEGCNDQLHRFLQLKTGGLEEVTIMWDGEAEALNAAILAGLRLMKLGLVVRLALLPKDKDPNEVPGSVVRQAIREAKPLDKALAVRWQLRNPYAQRVLRSV